MSRPFRKRLLPAGPLLELVKYRPQKTDTDLGQLLGVSPRTVKAWRESGVIALATGEKAAHHLGLHPAEIWGQTYYTTIKNGKDE